MKLTITLFCVLLFCATASAQSQCSTLEECNKKLTEAAQIINKLLDVDEVKDKLLAAKSRKNSCFAKTSRSERLRRSSAIIQIIL